MIETTLANEKRASVQHFEQDASQRPDIDHCSVVIGSEDQLRSAVASRTNIWQVGLIGQYFSRSKITNDQSSILHKQIMRLDIPMANAERMYVKQPSKGLICIQFHLKGRHCLAISSDVAVQIALVVFHDDVEILILVFFCRESTQNSHCVFSLQHWDDLHLAVLVFRILEDALNCHDLACFFYFGFVHLAKSALADKWNVLDIAFCKVFGRAIESAFFFVAGELIRAFALRQLLTLLLLLLNLLLFV